MPQVGIYTATDNDLQAVVAADAHLTDTLIAQSAADDPATMTDFVDQLLAQRASAPSAAVVLWLHGGPDSIPDYETVRDRLQAASIPIIVVSPSDGVHPDTTAAQSVGQTVLSYLDCGGATNIENCARYLVDHYTAADRTFDDPVSFPTEGVYHPAYPGIDYAGLCDQFDPTTPTVGLLLYRSYWLNENLRHIDALVDAIEARGADVLPVFCDPASKQATAATTEEVIDRYFLSDAGPVVDAVCSTLFYALSMEHRGQDAPTSPVDTQSVLHHLNVPLIQAMTTSRSRAAYHEADVGLKGYELALGVALPEFDGVTVTHPISGQEPLDDLGANATPACHQPLADRINHVAALAVNWAQLRYTPPADTRVAIVLHNYPPSDEGIGTAFGLDTPASLHGLLHTLADRGYDCGAGPGVADPIPADGQAIIDALTEQVTLETRWTDPVAAEQQAVGVLSESQYRQFFQSLPSRTQQAIRDEWGPPPDQPFAIPGLAFGNVIVLLQPPRGFDRDPEAIYHDSALWPPHTYLAAYTWLHEEFATDAVVHLGTHGSLEWLPGKTVGLDGSDAPDALIGAVPNIYPYIINNPGEGTQAKRRSYATIVDHLTPPMTAAGTYDELAELERLADRYREADTAARSEQLRELLCEAVVEHDLAEELALETAVETVDGDTLVTALHQYLTDIKRTQIRNGLHTLSTPPTGDRLVEYLIALTRLPQPGIPSLQRAVAGALGIDPDHIDAQPSTYDEQLGMTYAAAADRVQAASRELIETLAEWEFTLDGADRSATALTTTLSPIGTATADPEAISDLQTTIQAICTDIVPRIQQATTELPHIADALAGEYIPPGGSGAPTRSGIDVLPSGRNFYTLDPRKVPAQSAWEIGQQLAEDMLQTHYAEAGCYPEEVGVIAWGTPTVRTRGETIAQILALIGVRPVWRANGRIETVEAISLPELGRPRIDVTTRVSGLFRDVFPQAATIIHDAVETVLALDESPADNYLKKHVQEDRDQCSDGDPTDTAALTRRVFTTRPGGYGAGTNKAIEEGVWEEQSDLATAYIEWGGYAMTDTGDVIEAKETFKRRLGSIDATVKLEDTMEQDEFDSGDWYAFHGGLTAAVADQAGSTPASYVCDSATPSQLTVTTTDKRVRKTLRARVLNPDWLDSMTEHGYKGAGDLASTVEIALGWDATTDVLSDQLWADIADRYAFDDQRQAWLEEVNPWALASIAETLLEAIDRGLWTADQETADRLRDIALSADGAVETRQSQSDTETQ